jgi:WS/DGAT/MGAT family acyltransferase
VARRAGTIAAGLSDLLGPAAVAPQSTLNAPVGTFRTIVPVEFDFAGVDEIRAAHGGSANDVALTVIAGGLRAWFESRGEELPDLHVLCPVSERGVTAGEMRAGSGGNHVGAMLIELPLGEPDPVRRLAIIRERTGRAKSRHDGDGVAWALDAFDHLPTIPGVALRQLLAHQPFANLVVTNVPGPRRPLGFFGSKVVSAVPVVPLGPNTALGIALFSYDRVLTIGLHADPERCPELRVLADAALEEFEAMREDSATSDTRSAVDQAAKRSTKKSRPT